MGKGDPLITLSVLRHRGPWEREVVDQSCSARGRSRPIITAPPVWPTRPSCARVRLPQSAGDVTGGIDAVRWQGGFRQPGTSRACVIRLLSSWRLERRPGCPCARSISLAAPTAAVLAIPHSGAAGGRNAAPGHGGAVRSRGEVAGPAVQHERLCFRLPQRGMAGSGP